MAAGLSVRSIMMREAHFIPESNGDICDTASQGSKDEVIEYPSDFVEDRFRVDRKKLEQMLQAPSDIVYDEGAEEFFQRIMDETNTQITWPSKLKIGAKSKKDPHIKVVGYPDDVRSAKDKIMAVLDTKSNRVTLKMDVSHTEHSHVIGKGGNNIKKVMSETGCHIHFPDSNRGSNVQEKSNQVSIAGQSTGVEKARAQIRELLPLVFMFELPLAGMVQPLPDTTSPLLQHLQQTYSVTVTFKQRPRMFVVVVIVRGTVNNAKAVKEATAKLMEQLSGGVGGSLLASMQLEIAPQHHLFIIGRNGVNIKQIMQKTGASIHFPDPNNTTPQRKGSVFITGSIESVFLARQHLIGCLPLVLMFDVKEDVNLDQGPITKLMEELDVYISVKNKPKQPSKSVIVKSIERNAANMYRARARLLGEEEPPLPSCNNGVPSSSLPTSCLGLTLSYLNHPLLSVNTGNTLLMMNGQHSPSLGSPHSCPATPSPSSPNHWVSTSTGIYSPLMMVNPAATHRSLHGPLDILSHNGLHKEFSPNAFVRVPTPLEKGHSSNNSDSTSPPLSPRTSPSTVPINGSVSTGMKSAGTIGDIISREPSLTSSGHTLDLLGLSKTTGLPGSSNHFSRHLQQNGDKSPESSGGESDGSDKRAPGIERKNSASSLFANHTGNAFDYETKKLLAMRAMQKKPEGESRIPTDMWAGLGFSKSMPEAAIRERMGQLTMRSPPMQPSYENPAQELSEMNGEIDRDPWKDPNAPNNPPVNRAPGEYPSPRKKYEFGLSNSNHVDSASLPPKTHLSSADDKAGLVELFSKLGLGKYSDLFQQQEIDLPTFRTLTDLDLRELGITTFGARRKMLLAIADLNKRSTLRSAGPGGANHGVAPHTSNGHNPPTPFQEPGAPLPLTGVRRPDMASLSGRW